MNKKLDVFSKRKKDVLSKIDKSFKGEWDRKILDLCNKINSFENFYTTSSCSGRIILMLEKERKDRNLFLKCYHELITFEKIKKDLLSILKEIKGEELVKLKLEPCILHVACKSIKDASFLCELAKRAGWKKSCILSFNKKIIAELGSTEKFEFPIIKSKKILVDDNFLRIFVDEANKKMKRIWKKIEKLNEFLEKTPKYF